MALLVFDPADGHTINSYPLPEATGWPVGVSVGNDRRVVTATSDGRCTASRLPNGGVCMPGSSPG